MTKKHFLKENKIISIIHNIILQVTYSNVILLFK